MAVGWVVLLCLLGLRPASLVAQAPGSAPDGAVTIQFDAEAAGTRVADEYASSVGVHFLNDYQPGRAFRASPQITEHPNANSAPHVLVNEFQDTEIFSSSGVPMVIWFDQPVSAAAMWLGTVGRPDQGCSQNYAATLSAYDCHGSLLDQQSATANTAFNNVGQVTDYPLGRIRRIEIDYGSTTCPEAIDDFTVTPVAGECTDTSAPVVHITSHGPAAVVNTATQVISGTIAEQGILESVKVSGGAAQVHLDSASGLYLFTRVVTLSEGSNTVTVVAENGSGLKGTDKTVLTLGTPASVSLGQFHLTQRGVVKNTSCDLDSPFVAGKSTLARIYLSTKTAAGADTYVSSVEMRLYRKDTSGDTLVSTLQGTTYSPYLSLFNTPDAMTAIHFWIPGEQLDPAGQYKFVFQAYVGVTAVGPPLVANCGGSSYHAFVETQPVRIVIVPLEVASSDPNLDAAYQKAYFVQLATLARTYPVRDGFSSTAAGMTAGAYFHEAGPWPLCDGTADMQATHPDTCQGTGYTWQFIDRHASGLLRRADGGDVIDPLQTGCNADDHNMGGQIASTQTVTYPFTPNLGILRAGAHPYWNGNKAMLPKDDDHDGDIDTVDYAHYMAEFFDQQTNSWLTTPQVGQYDLGETFRFFQDSNVPRNNCNSAHDKIGNDPQAEIRQLSDHEQLLLNGQPALLALDAFNKATPGTASDAVHGSLWIPPQMVAQDHSFGGIGPGQGGGKQSWVQLASDSTLAHEVGHCFGLIDYYRASLDPDPDDLKTKEGAWAVYVGQQSFPPEQVSVVMGFSISGDMPSVVMYRPNYQTIFDALRVTTTVSAASGLGDQATEQFVISGTIDENGAPAGVQTGLASGLESTPAERLSPYSLVFGSGRTTLLVHRFALRETPTPPQRYDTWPLSFRSFHVVTPFPESTSWVELRREAEVLGRYERSAAVPRVQVVSPNGGEAFLAGDRTTIRWSASDRDGDPLRHTLYYSPDGGERWITVAAGIAGNSYEWSLQNAPGTPFGNGRIRVVTTDGFNAAADESDNGFQVGGKPPRAAILEPRRGETFLQCRRLRLAGVAHDPEEQLSSTVWTIDGSQAGTEPTVEVGPLPPGEHQIGFTVRDRDRMSATDQAAVTILPDADCDGMSDAFEDEHGFDSSVVDDAGWDSDEDGLVNLEEARYGTSPASPDTDGDGFTDGEEVQAGSSPTDPHDIPEAVCAGDCDKDGEVTVDELVRGVNIALGIMPVGECLPFDRDGDGEVTVDELVVGVGNALEGC